MISWIIITEVCVICRSRRLRQITEGEGWAEAEPKPKAEADNRHEVLIIHDIMRKPNSVIVLLYIIFHIIHRQKQKRSIQPFWFWGEHPKGLSDQADIEVDMINAISAADIVFIMSSSQAILNWLNALNQSDIS